MTDTFSTQVLYMGMTGGRDRLAVTDRHGDWTWTELFDCKEEIVAKLRELDLTPRSRILIIGPDSIWHQLVIMACSDTGHIAVPISVKYGPRELQNALDLTKPAAALVEPELASMIDETGSTLTGKLGPWDIYQWQVTDSATIAERRTQREPILITLTSGSTALPKPVLYSAEGELAVSRLHASTWRLNDQDVVMSGLPFSWIYGLSTVNFAALHAGSQLAIPERFSPMLICDLAEKRDVTVFMGVGTHFRILIDYCRATGRRPFGPKLRMAVTGGERRDEELFREFEDLFGVPVHDLYASSEVRPGFGYDPLVDERPVAGSCGRPITGVDARIEPDEHSAPGDGLLYVRTPGVFMGYFNPVNVVEEELTERDWIKLGDRFAIVDGLGYVRGRANEVIKRGGANVSPAEVEEVIATHQGVRSVAVVGVESSTHGEEVAAAVIGAFDTSSDVAARLTEHCAGVLAAFKTPTRWMLLEQLPQNSNQKVDKFGIQRLFQDEAGTPIETSSELSGQLQEGMAL